jgi:mannose-6-phosphate isomerase-like protein (cupin superfamily)
MDAYSVSALLRAHDWSGVKYSEFLRKESLSLGLYLLPKGSTDPQSPHREDEVYYVISGKGAIRVAAEDQPVGPGSTVFVAKEVEHHFHSITEDLTILVFFAPAESSGTPRSSSKG